MVKLNAWCSAILQYELPRKEKDPGSFVLPCIIVTTTISNALVDLGASISVMPFFMFKCLGLGDPKPVNMVIEMADRSMKSPKGIVKNVLVKIHKFIFPVDFGILDIVEDNKIPIILGRPMLANAHARIDIFERKNLFGNLLMDEDINDDLGSFIQNNNLLPGYEDPRAAPPSPSKTPFRDWNLDEELQDPNDDFGIGIDDIVTIDALWDSLDPGIMAYNSVIKQELVYTGNNIIGMEKNLHVFIGKQTFLTDFIILENMNEFVEKGLTEVILGFYSLGLEFEVYSSQFQVQIKGSVGVTTWLRRNRRDYGVLVAIAIAKDHGVTKGARHFGAKVHYLRETIEMGDVRIEKVDTDNNLADPFTKALEFPKHSELTNKIGMIPASSLM
ncbi:retrovirus-related pol polyprotein from transposon TNT 1-94 [Tanacetum coccineum]|uniref:Retrovirus-related pol polyprotein from transposon TNT 1-94 n=1 Tax=Tanacetum coccineum TaxID=301880 RepID=A0ABQ5AFA6_9ASTR